MVRWRAKVESRFSAEVEGMPNTPRKGPNVHRFMLEDTITAHMPGVGVAADSLKSEAA